MHHRARHAPRRSWSAASVALVAAAGILLAPACSLGDKARLEERITAAPGRLEGALVAGTMSVESRLTDVPAGVSAFGPGIGGAGAGADGDPPEFPAEGVSLGLARVSFVLDLATSRATLLKTDEATPQPAEPAVVFDDLVLYGRRGGIPADDARPWVRLDLDELDESAGALDPLDGTGTTAIYALHPALLADLVAGTLTGSIEQREPAAEDASLAPGTTRYAVNVSVRKALEDRRRARYPERRRESIEELLRLLGVVGDLHPGEVWLDGEGRMRRFRIEFGQEPQRKVKFRMVVSVDLPPATPGEAPALVPAPGVDKVLGVDSVLRFTSTVVTTGTAEDEPVDDAPPAVPPPTEPGPGTAP